MSGPDATPVPIGLSLGSNVGAAPANLRAALARLAAGGKIGIDAVSSIYRTAPWGPVPQSDFANLCALGHTALAPLALLDTLKAIEAEIGRMPGDRWGPRLIDIDIIFYGDLRLETAELTLPHREAARRAFVMIPLAEIAPDVRLGGERAADIAARLGPSGVDAWPAPA